MTGNKQLIRACDDEFIDRLRKAVVLIVSAALESSPGVESFIPVCDKPLAQNSTNNIACENVTATHGDNSAHTPECVDLRAIVQRIEEAALATFRNEEKPKFERLYDALTQTGIPLPALSVCGRGTAEIRYTQLLRYFLDPRSPHGIGASLLEVVFADELLRVNAPKLDFSKARVEAEVNLGEITHGVRKIGCSLDLLITLPGYHILIEQKINSSETGSSITGEITQLDRYTRAIENNRKDIDICGGKALGLFLTPNARSPKKTAESFTWLPLSHETLMLRCTRVLKDKRLSPAARYNICCLLWDLTLGPIIQDGNFLDELRQRLSSVIRDHKSYFNFKDWCERNLVSIESLLETVEVGNGAKNV